MLGNAGGYSTLGDTVRKVSAAGQVLVLDLFPPDVPEDD